MNAIHAPINPSKTAAMPLVIHVANNIVKRILVVCDGFNMNCCIIPTLRFERRSFFERKLFSN